VQVAKSVQQCMKSTITFLQSGLVSPSTNTQTSSHAHGFSKSFQGSSAAIPASTATPLRSPCRRSMQPFTSRPLRVMYTVWPGLRRAAVTVWNPMPNTSDSRKVCVEPLESKRTTYDCCADVRDAGSDVDAIGCTDTITPGYRRPSASGAETLLPTIERFPGRLPLAIRQHVDGAIHRASADDRSRCRVRIIRSLSDNEPQRQLFQDAGDCYVFVVVVGQLGQPGSALARFCFPM